MAARSSTPASQRSVPYCLVPPGHIIVSDRLVGQPLHEALKDEGVKLIVEGSLHFVDCYPSSSCGVVYLGQNVVVSEDKTTRRKLEKVSKSTLTGVVIVECTTSSESFFQQLQMSLMLEYKLRVVPVGSPQEAAKIITQMSKKVHSPSTNPFLGTKPTPAPDPLILQAVQLLPRTGSTTGKHLLQKFNSLQGIASASVQELAEVMGKANAQTLYQFLHSS